MPPKVTGPSKKTEQKRQDKVIEDKTFGLKNKNKSKTVQNYVKSVASQVKKLDGKGGESKRLADEFALKAAQKKDEEKKALLNSLFKSVKKTQEIVSESESEGEQDDRYEEIDLYTDQREQIYSRRGEGEGAQNDELEEWHANKDKTDKICKFFLDSVEAGKYGWRWKCPNGMGCMYKHALPPGYTLKRDQPTGDKKADTILEEELERERALLTGGTPVTLERFLKWKEDKRIKKEKEAEQKRLEEIKKSKGNTNVMSGRALFTYDPSLFQDDAEALDDEEYAEEENREEEEEKQDRPIDEEDEEEEEDEQEEEEKEEETEKISLNNNEGDGQATETKKKKKSNKKKQDNVKINEDVFLGEEDVELPEDDS